MSGQMVEVRLDALLELRRAVMAERAAREDADAARERISS